MSNNVQMVFSGDTASLEKSFDRLMKKMDEMMLKNEKIAAKAAEGSKKVSDGLSHQESQIGKVFTSWAVGLTATVAGYFTLQSAISAVNRVLEKQSQLQRDALSSTQQLSMIDAALVSNLKQGEDFNAAKNRVLGMASKFGITDMSHLAESVKFGLSKAGGKAGMGLDAVETALGITAKLPQETAPTTEALVALQRIGLSKDEAADMLASAQTALPFANQGDLAQRAIAPVVGARAFFDKRIGGAEMAKQHIALTGLFHQSGATPEVAASGALGMEGALHDLFTTDRQLRAIDPGDTEGRLAILQGQQELGRRLAPHMRARLQKELGEDLPGRQLTDAIGRQLISGELMGSYRELKGGITEKGTAYEEMSGKILSGTPQLAIDTVKKQSEVQKMIKEAATVPLAASGSIAEIMDKMQARAYENSNFGGAWFEGVSNFDLAATKATHGAKSDMYQQAALRWAREYAGIQRSVVGGQEQFYATPLERYAPDQREVIEYQRQQLKSLQELVELSKNNQPQAASPAAAAEVARKQ